MKPLSQLINHFNWLSLVYLALMFSLAIYLIISIFRLIAQLWPAKKPVNPVNRLRDTRRKDDADFKDALASFAFITIILIICLIITAGK